jgi:hypothetical protein
MTRSKTRWTLAGLVALAALGAVALLEVGALTAEAAPSASPFAGSYVGADPQGAYGEWALKISDGGRITGSYVGADVYTRTSLGGQVSADGSYSLSVSVTYRNPEYGPRDKRRWLTEGYDSTGNLTQDASGDLVGTTDTGRTFSWLRQ